MLNQAQVDAWLDEFVTKLKGAFGNRLVWIGHNGSWASGEARPESDIDCMVVVNQIEDDDLTTFRDIMSSMPEAEKLGSGLLMSVSELKQTPPSYLVQFFHGRKVLYGSIEGIIEPPTSEGLIGDIRIKASDNLCAARHYLLFPHDLPKVIHRLKYHFKNCFYALQSWILLTQGKFIDTKNEIMERLDNPDDVEVVRTARDWYTLTDDLTTRSAYYIELLERWARGMMRKLETFQNEWSNQ